MNKFLSILILILVALSCGSKPEVSEEETQKQENVINIETLSDRELFYYTEELEKKLIDQESLELSKEYSVKLLEASQKHIEKYPKSQFRREIMRKGSRAAQGLNQDFEAVRILSISIAENQNDSTIIEEMNNRAFLYYKMQDKENAIKAFKEIKEKFPDDPSIESHDAMIETIDMNSDELTEYLEKKNAQ